MLHKMELFSVRVTLNLHSTCHMWHFQPQGLSQIYNFMEFKSLNPLVFTLSYFLNNFMYNSPKYKSCRVCFLG